VPSTPERDVHLLLGQKAARVLYDVLEGAIANSEYSEDWNTIFSAITADLREQIESKPKKAKKKVKK
jgi:hypothetical protein